MFRILFILVQLATMDMAWAGRRAESVPPIFRGMEAVTEDFVSSDDEKLNRLVAEQLTQYGVSIYNVRSHGMNQQEFVEGKAKSRFNRLYLDALVTAKHWTLFPFKREAFTFDIVYSKGSEFFPESEPEVIHGCKGRRRGDSVELKINECIQKHLEGA
jgi:hypothetical protein